MTLASLTTHRLGRLRTRWFEPAVSFAVRHRFAWPAVAIVCATIGAYHYTLASLANFLRLDTPLAYLALLPFVSIGIAIITARRYAHARPPLADRQHDFIVGVPLLVIALLLITWQPIISSTSYWFNRADVISLALFAAAAVILVYGINWFGRQKTALFLLLFMWPTPYLFLMAPVIEPFRHWVDLGLAQVAAHVPIGVHLVSQPAVLAVKQSHGAMNIAVSSVSSGADSLLGFTLLGWAILTVMTGGKQRKLRWWISGLFLALVLNIVRMLVIVMLAERGFAAPARGAYHPLIGLILLAVTLVIMLWALPLFGLRIKDPVPGLTKPLSGVTSTAPLSRRRLKIARAAALAFTMLMAFADHGLQPYAAFDDGTGSATVQPFSAGASAPAGWHIRHVSSFRWAAQYFGIRAVWDRYTVSGPGGTSTVIADVLRTNDKGTLDVCNPQNCYLYRNEDIRTTGRVDLGRGVYGFLLNYRDSTSGSTWAAVAWTWPIIEHHETLYERIVLSSSSSLSEQLKPRLNAASGPQDVFLDLLNSATGAQADLSTTPRFRPVDTLLRADAQVLVGRALGKQEVTP